VKTMRTLGLTGWKAMLGPAADSPQACMYIDERYEHKLVSGASRYMQMHWVSRQQYPDLRRCLRDSTVLYTSIRSGLCNGIVRANYKQDGTKSTRTNMSGSKVTGKTRTCNLEWSIGSLNTQGKTHAEPTSIPRPLALIMAVQSNGLPSPNVCIS
jgi:hypothetical protein